MCQENFIDAKSALLDMCYDFEQPVQDSRRNDSVPTARSRALPNISLLRFTGKYSDWPPFRDLFSSMVISNSDLSPVERLQYLKTSVSGEALKVISGIAITGDNVDRAWTRLTSRFDNKRALVNSYLDELFSLKPVTKKSSRELEHLRTSVAGVVESLRTLGAEVDKWDFFLVYFVCRRLDPETHEAWEIFLGASTEPPTYSALDTFLESRSRALETVNARSTPTNPRSPATPPSTAPTARVHTSSPRQSSSTLVTPSTQRAPCPYCSGQHYVGACPTYKAKNTQERREFISSKNLCFNCLGQHRRSDCRSSKRCSVCNRDHHSTLHEGTGDSSGDPSSHLRVPAPSTAPRSLEGGSSVHHAILEGDRARPQV